MEIFTLRKLIQKNSILFVFLVLGIVFGTWIRFNNLFHPGFNFDTVTTFYTWGTNALDLGFYEFWRFYQEWLDYLPGSIYLLMVLVRIARLWSNSPEGFMIVLKVFNWIFDALFSGILIYISQKYGKFSWNKSVALGTLAYILPSFWFISGVWGQIDSLVMVLGIISVLLLYKGVKDNQIKKIKAVFGSAEFWSGVILGIGFWIKMQVVLLFPIFLIFHLTTRKRQIFIQQVLGFLLISSLIILIPLFSNPIRLAVNLAAPFTRENTVSRGAATFWTLIEAGKYASDPLIQINGQFVISIITTATVLFLSVLISSVFIYLRKHSQQGLSFSGFSILMTNNALAYFVFITKMYARYLLPATMFALVALATMREKKQRLIWLIAAILLSFAQFLNLINVYHGWGYQEPGWVANLLTVFRFNEMSLSSILSLLCLVMLYCSVVSSRKISKSVDTNKTGRN